jgi:uncharacterized protein (UPF0264 family)
MADPSVWREVAEAVGSRAPLSVALGEVRDFRGEQPCPSFVQFAKLGLAGCAAVGDWAARWERIFEGIPPHVNRVAVSYADWRMAEAPPPRDVIEAGQALGCTAWLIDTYGKQSGGLLDHIGLDELAELIRLARRAGMLAVVAGSLTLDSIPRVTPLSPDYLAVRGAVCRGGRTRVLDPLLVRELAILISPGA